MPSRLLAQLAARIAAARTPVEAACARAEYAVYWARQGQPAKATAIVQAIRVEFAATPNAEVTAWVSLAEALILFFGKPGPQAIDRLKRAHVLSRAISHARLVPLCAAWLAHLEFNAGHMPPMLQYATETLRLAQPEHHAALARVSLVIADAFHFAGRFDLAKHWYAAVREHALAEGDDSMISAMMHNVAALRANQVRLADSFGQPEPSEAKRAQFEAESTRNYDIGIGTLSLASLIPLVRAQLFTAEGRYADAIPLYSQTLDHDEPEKLERRDPCFFADRAWCHFQLGHMEAALADALAAEKSASPSFDADDLATTYSRIGNIFERMGQFDHAANCRDLASQSLDVHIAAQADLLSRLLAVLPDGKWAASTPR
jgi:tetratricopeptide (TPR) repeat protein